MDIMAFIKDTNNRNDSTLVALLREITQALKVGSPSATSYTTAILHDPINKAYQLAQCLNRDLKKHGSKTPSDNKTNAVSPDDKTKFRAHYLKLVTDITYDLLMSLKRREKPDREKIESLSEIADILDDEKIRNNEGPKKRGKGKLNKQVGKLLKTSRADITASKIAKILNNNYRGTYLETTIDSVRKTEGWKNRSQPKKK